VFLFISENNKYLDYYVKKS